MPLRWIIREGFLAQTRTSFKVDGLREVGLDPSTLYPDVLLHPEAPLLKRADLDQVGYTHGAVSVVSQV